MKKLRIDAEPVAVDLQVDDNGDVVIESATLERFRELHALFTHAPSTANGGTVKKGGRTRAATAVAGDDGAAAAAAAVAAYGGSPESAAKSAAVKRQVGLVTFVCFSCFFLVTFVSDKYDLPALLLLPNTHSPSLSSFVRSLTYAVRWCTH
jgi:hypothetical protein